MKAIVLAALVAIGAALAAPTSASAAPIGGLDKAAAGNSLVEPAYYGCRRVRVCSGGYYHRHCWWRRTCRHW